MTTPAMKERVKRNFANEPFGSRTARWFSLDMRSGTNVLEMPVEFEGDKAILEVSRQRGPKGVFYYVGKERGAASGVKVTGASMEAVLTEGTGQLMEKLVKRAA